MLGMGLYASCYAEYPSTRIGTPCNIVSDTMSHQNLSLQRQTVSNLKNDWCDLMNRFEMERRTNSDRRGGSPTCIHASTAWETTADWTSSELMSNPSFKASSASAPVSPVSCHPKGGAVQQIHSSIHPPVHHIHPILIHRIHPIHSFINPSSLVSPSIHPSSHPFPHTSHVYTSSHSSIHSLQMHTFISPLHPVGCTSRPPSMNWESLCEFNSESLAVRGEGHCV